MENLVEKLFDFMGDLKTNMKELHRKFKRGEIGEVDYILRSYALANQVIAINKYAEKGGLIDINVISMADQYEADSESIRENLLKIIELRKPENIVKYLKV